MRRLPVRRAAAGFTLVELLVALSVLALVALLSWRGIDGMARAQEQTRNRGDEIAGLQTGLAQWAADLDAMVEQQQPQVAPLDWDGRALRITRRSAEGDGDGLRVVAWGQAARGAGGRWLRWESPPVRTRGQWDEAWQQAALWGQNPGAELRAREVDVAAADALQVFYYRGNAWTNPLSSGAGNAAAASAVATQIGLDARLAAPDGVRLVLVLSPGQSLAGEIVRDWVRPTLTGGPP
jgi:general secretion pathway protein J